MSIETSISGSTPAARTPTRAQVRVRSLSSIFDLGGLHRDFVGGDDGVVETVMSKFWMRVNTRI